MIKHCILCKYRKTKRCPSPRSCFDNVERPFFNPKYINTKITLKEKIRLLFKRKQCSVDETKYFTTKLYYKILDNNVYVIKEISEPKHD